jgi:hypothetical protein
MASRRGPLRITGAQPEWRTCYVVTYRNCT